jgi:tRNA(Arg) A34 adenosine deaminase TadA
MNHSDQDVRFIREAIELAKVHSHSGDGGPFGVVVVKQGNIVGSGWNKVVSTNDPTAHAEVVAIRSACQKLGTFYLNGCVLYSSCEPCPMCLGAIYRARIDRIVFAAGRADAAAVGFDDDHIYREIQLPLMTRSISMTQFLREEAVEVMRAWCDLPNSTMY